MNEVVISKWKGVAVGIICVASFISTFNRNGNKIGVTMKEVVEIIVQNWEYVIIGILAIDKAVALSPSTWDDLLWTSVKKSIYKIAGKK